MGFSSPPLILRTHPEYNPGSWIYFATLCSKALQDPNMASYGTSTRVSIITASTKPGSGVNAGLRMRCWAAKSFTIIPTGGQLRHSLLYTPTYTCIALAAESDKFHILKPENVEDEAHCYGSHRICRAGGHSTGSPEQIHYFDRSACTQRSASTQAHCARSRHI